jgi:hypothetical protein
LITEVDDAVFTDIVSFIEKELHAAAQTVDDTETQLLQAPFYAGTPVEK